MTKSNVAKIGTYKTLKDFQDAAARIVSANGRNRGLMQEASIGCLEHMKAHGDYTVIFPLALAAQSFGRNLSNVWIGWITAHSWLVYNPEGLVGRKLAETSIEKLLVRDKTKKADSIDADKAKAVNWWEYKRPTDTGEAEPLNVPQAISRFTKRLAKAFAAELAVGADDKPLSQETILKMVTDGLNAAFAKAEKAKPITGTSKPEQEVKAKRKVAKGRNVAAKRTKRTAPVAKAA